MREKPVVWKGDIQDINEYNETTLEEDSRVVSYTLHLKDEKEGVDELLEFTVNLAPKEKRLTEGIQLEFNLRAPGKSIKTWKYDGDVEKSYFNGILCASHTKSYVCTVRSGYIMDVVRVMLIQMEFGGHMKNGNEDPKGKFEIYLW